MISQLLEHRDWLTIDEAACFLSAELKDRIEPKDIYRFALDGNIRLATHFVNGAFIMLCPLKASKDSENSDIYISAVSKTLEELNEKAIQTPEFDVVRLDGKELSHKDSKIFFVDGVWDLPMLGNEKLSIEDLFQSLTNGPEITISYSVGTLVERNGVIFKILIDAGRDYLSAAGLLSDSVLVIKKNEIVSLVNSFVLNKSREKKFSKTKEKQTLLVLVAALCKELRIDPHKRGVAVAIQKMTENLGTPISDDTIRKILNQIDEAITARSK